MKLIFFDIDGTLVERGKIPDSAVRAIRKAQENGHLCLVNTGRTACLVTGWLPELVPFDGYLCGCGTQILFHGKEILHKTFSREEALDILEGLKKYRIDAILEGSGNNYHEDPANMYTETFRRYIAKASPERYMPKELVEKGWGSYGQAPGKFDKFYCFADDPEAVKLFAGERPELLSLIDRENGYYEIMPKGFSKASGMDALIDALNASGEYGEAITLADTAAIGDSGNDIEMLRHAGTAIAMGNSTKEVMDMADFVTGRVNEDGIARALEWLGVCGDAV